MKTSNFVSMMSVAVALVLPAFAQAQNFGAPGPAPTRTFLGIPLPQQWNGVRPASGSQYPANRPYGGNSYYGADSRNCANGNCSTGTCTTGNCRSGSCPNGRCATGQAGSCVSGQCGVTGQCAGGQCVTGNCPNGRCPLNQNFDTRDYSGTLNGAQRDWSPRTTRSNPVNPFRGVESRNGNDNWTQRPAMRNPVNDLYRSRYNESDLNLRRQYFNDQSSELNSNQSARPSSAASDLRAPRPSDRSMFTVPAERASGLAQI